MQLEAPSEEYDPAAHDMQPEEPKALTEYLPAAHRAQVEAPAVEIDPGAQAEHVAAAADEDPSGPKLPAAQDVPEHVAAAADEDPSGPYLPAAQGVPEHTVAPGAVE